MTSSLLISVYFNEGRYYGQDDGFDADEGWPPSPGRLFQALVAAAARGAHLPAEDESALSWLEKLAPPGVVAPPARRGRAVKLFVPNNDLDAVGGDPDRVSEIRVGKLWRPCLFDEREPVLYAWDFESGTREAERICSIAERLYQLGRGVDMAWAHGRSLGQDEADAILDAHPGVLRRAGGSGRTPTPQNGTLNSLIEQYRGKRTRLTREGTGRKARVLFTQPPRAAFRHVGYDHPPRRLHFELRNADGRFRPCPLAQAMPLVTGLRDTAAHRLQESLPTKTAVFERLIIGRNAGPQDLAQRVRLIPIPSIGAEHVDPSIRRIMVEVPAACPIRTDDLKWAFAGAGLHDPQTEEHRNVTVVSAQDKQMASRFLRDARTFRSITPVAIPNVQRRRLASGDVKAGGERLDEEAQACAAVKQALRHAGTRVRPSAVRVQREPFQRKGVRADQFVAAPRFSKHALWHVELRFQEPIKGPLLIGDGRFVGLGLFEPVVEHRDDVIAFDLKRHVRSEDRPTLVHHLRRALMSIARDETGRVTTLFSGHEPSGQPDHKGHHAHVFLAADGPPDEPGSITRLLVVAPWSADRRAKRDDASRFDTVTRGLVQLQAGRLGRFDGLMAEAVDDEDALIGPARVWTARTPYQSTRHLKKRDNADEAIKTDVVTECARRGLPRPEEVALSNVHVGRKGGRPTARVTLRFAVPVRGPVLLGRNSHSGGGLFHAARP